MKTKVLADIIQDFLEMNCKMPEKERSYLVRELGHEPFASEAIEVHPAFSVDGKIVVVKNTPAPATVITIVDRTMRQSDTGRRRDLASSSAATPADAPWTNCQRSKRRCLLPCHAPKTALAATQSGKTGGVTPNSPF